MRYFFCMFLLCLFGWRNLQAQYQQAPDSCLLKLRTAETLFKRGAIESVPTLLLSCADLLHKTNNRLLAYELLAQSYAFMDMDSLSHYYTVKILETNPLYRITDVTEYSQQFVRNFTTIRKNPVWSLGIVVGGNYTIRPEILHEEEIAFYTVKEKKPMRSSFGLIAEYNISNKLGIAFQTILYDRQFSTIYKIPPDTAGVIIMYDLRHQDLVLDFPITFRYNFAKRGHFIPYMGTGISTNFLLKTQQTKTKERLISREKTVESVEKNSLRSELITLNTAILMEAGIRYLRPHSHFFLNVSYHIPLRGQRKGYTIESGKLSYYGDYDYPPFKLLMNSFQLKVGYAISFYNFKKIIIPSFSKKI